MVNYKRLMKNWRIILLVVSLLLAVYFISPHPFNTGAAIRSVEKGSAADVAGIAQPGPGVKPVDRERITAINGKPVQSAAEYFAATADIHYNRTITITTNVRTYRVTPQANTYTLTLNQTAQKNITTWELVNETHNGITQAVNVSVNKTVTVPVTKVIVNGTKDLGLQVFDAPQTNIRTGLDLQGGTRVLLEPEKKLDKQDLDTLISSMKERLNVYGLSDITVQPATDLSGNQYILVEIAGVSESEVQSLLAKQGKFEAKIGNQTLFVGGKDITFVCRSAECSGLDPQHGCGMTSSGQVACGYRVAITITQDAAKRQAAMTRQLSVVPSPQGGSYLSKPIDLYLDDKLVDSLQISSDLRGVPTTQIQISGSGVGPTTRAASDNALQQMHQMQTVLITGSLPVKLNIIKTDAISANLGAQFLQNALLIAIVSIIAVMLILIIVYRKLVIALPIFVTMLLEVIIVLGVAALIGWNIDLAAVAGIIAAVGTGVDDQIVITDETLRGVKHKSATLKDSLKSAFFIIFGSYLTVVVAMVPLIFAGAGLLKGFAITTILGVSIGVFITRPAFAAIIEELFA